VPHAGAPAPTGPGSGSPATSAPTDILAAQRSHPAHYHQADQFQVMVAGAGSLGTHAVAEGAVHFAGAWSAYGPLAAGQGGLHYFTLRNGWDPGARYMEFPDNRAMLRALPRRHREVVGEVSGAPDGLSARRYHLDSGVSATGPDPAESGGQFWLVLAGSMQRDGAALAPRSCIFVYPHEPALTATGGPEGLAVLMLQFPKA
jgi:hypothetical protein